MFLLWLQYPCAITQENWLSTASRFCEGRQKHQREGRAVTSQQSGLQELCCPLSCRHCFQGENPSLSQHQQGGREGQCSPSTRLCVLVQEQSKLLPCTGPAAGTCWDMGWRTGRGRHETVAGWLSPEEHRLWVSYSLNLQVTATSTSKCSDSTTPTCHV